MRLLIWTRNEGITDDTFKDGDIFRIFPDSWVPGAMETRRWLAVQIDGSTGASDQELIASEYSVGPSNEPILRRMRKYRLNYEPKLTPEELTAAKDRDGDVPLLVGRFTMDDVVRK